MELQFRMKMERATASLSLYEIKEAIAKYIEERAEGWRVVRDTIEIDAMPAVRVEREVKE